jgi:hypothetical protein
MMIAMADWIAKKKEYKSANGTAWSIIDLRQSKAYKKW